MDTWGLGCETRGGLERQLGAAQARVAGPTGRWKETPLRRDHFLTELPSAEPELANTALISIAPGDVTVSSTVVGPYARIEDLRSPVPRSARS
jgi:hypothetical protein